MTAMYLKIRLLTKVREDVKKLTDIPEVFRLTRLISKPCVFVVSLPSILRFLGDNATLARAVRLTGNGTTMVPDVTLALLVMEKWPRLGRHIPVTS